MPSFDSFATKCEMALAITKSSWLPFAALCRPSLLFIKVDISNSVSRSVSRKTFYLIVETSSEIIIGLETEVVRKPISPLNVSLDEERVLVAYKFS